MFIIVILSLFVVGDLLWARHIWQTLRRPEVRGRPLAGWAMAFAALFLLITVASLVTAMATRATGSPHLLPFPLLALVFVWHLVVLPATLLTSFILLLAQSLAHLFKRLTAAKPNPQSAIDNPQSKTSPTSDIPPPTSDIAPTRLTRRSFLALSAATVPPIVAFSTTGYALSTVHAFRTRDADLPIPGLPPDLDGLTVAHLTDTHLGDFSGPAVYRRMIDATNALRADLIVHTGDVINVDSDDIPEAMAGLARLDARLGVFVCEGNHDLIQSPGRFWRAIRAVPNLRFLRNDSADLTVRGVPVRIAGARWSTRADAQGVAGAGTDSPADRGIRAACEDLAPHPAYSAANPASAFNLLLAHHPHAFDYAPWAHLTLAGHTHGGQLNVTKHLSPGYLMYRYWSGTYRTPARTLHVSNGAGNWFPLRINAPAEIVKLTLRRA